MAQALTLTVGAWLWWFASSEHDTRYTMGTGGPLLYLGIWLFVLVLVAAHERRRRSTPPASRLVRSLKWIVGAIGLGVACSTATGIALNGFGIAYAPDATMIGLYLAGCCGLLAVPVLLLVRPTPGPRATPVPVLALVNAFLPLLCPVLAMFALRASPVDGSWNVETAPQGRAGILYLSSLALWLPTAALVAWGIDRLDGSRGGRLANALAGLTLLVLGASVVLLPSLLADLANGRSYASGMGMGYANALRFWRPFDTPSQLPLDGWFRATGAMMLCAAVATTSALRALGRARRLAWSPVSALVLVGQVVLTLQLQPEAGPALAAWLAAAAALLLAALHTLPWPRPFPARAATPVAADESRPDSRMHSIPA